MCDLYTYVVGVKVRTKGKDRTEKETVTEKKNEK